MANTLENKLNITQIVKNANMSARPEFYSGRGAILDDLNSDILEKIYLGIKKNYGKKQANAYAKMVEKIPKLSATDFLLSLYELEANKWNLKELNLKDKVGIYVDGPNDKAKIAVGFMTIAGCLHGDNARDETNSIKGQFLRKHDIKSKYNRVDENGNQYAFY